MVSLTIKPSEENRTYGDQFSDTIYDSLLLTSAIQNTTLLKECNKFITKLRFSEHASALFEG
jgi:hypothetical protein